MATTAPPTRSLEQYVPRIAAEWDLDAPDRSWQVIDATLCFVDISGFTNLSERLARFGRIGAEELTDVLNRVFGTMLELAYAQGGSLLKFGGDALLLVFTGHDHALRAVSAAIEMRSALRAAASEKTSVGRLKLRMSVGVHTGPIHLFRTGRAHRELVITGPGGTSTTEMEKTANPGEIVISEETRAALPGAPATEPRGRGWLLKWRKPQCIAEGPIVKRASRSEDANTWVPTTLCDFLLAAPAEPEHRIATVGFIRYCDVDQQLERDGPEAVAERLDATITAIQEAAEEEDVTFLATDINEDGGKVILTAGSPTAQEDDEGRMLRTLRRLIDRQTPLHLHVGVNRGHVFSGEVGTAYRSTYTVMGDTVNLAARLMAAAPEGAIYATPGVLDQSRTLFAVDTLEPFHVKGKAEPVQAYAVGEETGDRSADVRSDLPFIGREAELAEIRAAVDEWTAGTGGVVTIVGDTGSGKSRLAQEALPQESEAEIIALRSEPYGTASPYRPFRDPVRELLGVERGTQDEMVEQLTAGVARIDPDLFPMAPLLGDLAHVDLSPTPESKAIEPRFRRDRLADVFTRLLTKLDADRLVITAEDAHWMDEASAHLLAKLAEATADYPWLLVATRRETDTGFDPLIGRRLELNPLEPEQARELIIAATASTPLRPHDVDVIVARGGGNPFFLGEILRIVRETGSTDALPDSLGSMVSTEIDALAPLTRRVLRYCSILGRSFRTVVVREILTQDNLVLDSATRSALSQFIVGDGSGRLRFRHAMVRDVAYDGLSFKRRQILHLRAGEVIEAMADDNTEGVADILAMHYSIGRDHGRAWQYGRIAGDRAREAYANEEAAVQYERALEAARRLEACPERDLRTVWTHLGDVREQAGRYDGALDAYRKASQLAGEDPIARAELHLKRARARERSGAYSIALRETTTGYRLVAGLSAQPAAAMRSRLSAFRATIRQAQERPEEALRIAERAADEAKAADERAALGRSFEVLDWAHYMMGRPELAIYSEQALPVYEELGRLEALGIVKSNLGAAAYFDGAWGDALEFYQQAAAALRRAGNSVQAAAADANLGEVYTNQGRFEEAEPVLRDAARVLKASRVLDYATFAEIQIGRVLMEQGDLDTAEGLLSKTQAQGMELGLTNTALEAAIFLAECSVLRKPAAALSVLDEAETDAGADYAAYYEPSLNRVRAAALLTLDELGEAERLASAGLAAAREAGLPYEEALLLLTVANIKDRGELGAEPAEREEAHKLLADLGVRRVPASIDALNQRSHLGSPEPR
jgi:class 3 adenylate cyclase/tetratricopeptide (TPR) repeat protein